MPANFGITPYSSETLPANTFPISATFVPGTSSGNLIALQGGPASTDGNGYTSAPAAMYVADGSDVAQGTSTDSAGANSVIGQLKQIRLNTASVTIGSGTVTANQGGSWTVTANAGTNLNTSALALESGNLAAILADTGDIESSVANIPPLGQALAAASVPVVLTAIQQAALTPPAAIVGFALDTSVQELNIALEELTQAQGSSTSGQVGPLMQGAVTTSAPSYANAQTSPISLTTAGAVRVDASATTQPVSGTVTANVGTTNGLALDASVAKINVAQGSALGSNTGPMIQGSVTTNAPSYSTGNINPLSLDTSGLLRASLKDTPSNTNNINVNLAASAATVTVAGSGNFTVAQATGSNLHAVLDSGSTTAATQATAANLNAQVVGSVASAGSNAGNPVKIGGVFNTTQPTVTNGQIVDAQTSARGAQIVATGADTFNVTVNAALPAGSAVIGSTTIQATSGTALVADQSNTELRASIYGKSTTAGDTAIKVNSSGDQYVLGDFTEQAPLSAGSLNADLVPSTDVSAYKWLSLHLNTNAWVGTLTFQGSNDNSNWTTIQVSGGNSLNNYTGTVTTSTNTLWHGPVYYRYLRVRMTSYTSGAAQGTLELYTSPNWYTTNSMLQNGTWTVQPGNTPNTTAWKVDGSAVTQPVSGTVSVNALPTGGNTIGAVTQASGPWTSNITQVLSAALSNTNPMLVEPNVQNWMRNGQAFVVSTGLVTGASATCGLSIWNASSGKNALIYSIRFLDQQGGQAQYGQIYKVTSNPALANSSTPVNKNFGSGTTSLMTCTNATSGVSLSGTLLESFPSNSPAVTELIAPGSGYFLPGANNTGLAIQVLMTGTGGFVQVSVHYVEF